MCQLSEFYLLQFINPSSELLLLLFPKYHLGEYIRPRGRFSTLKCIYLSASKSICVKALSRTFINTLLNSFKTLLKALCWSTLKLLNKNASKSISVCLFKIWIRLAFERWSLNEWTCKTSQKLPNVQLIKIQTRSVKCDDVYLWLKNSRIIFWTLTC